MVDTSILLKSNMGKREYVLELVLG
jgi:hypothetical protein